jgi:hypothetical protein
VSALQHAYNSNRRLNRTEGPSQSHARTAGLL